jgi:Tol biopolymer transport system component
MPCEIMALTIGTQLGSHEITALLGKGGMGEVYRARDLKLKREVAIKILPEEFARDAERVSRFQREAEVLATLNHPNIAAIHDLEESSGTRYLVLELVEGETLADRIARGPISIDEALVIAKQICEALEAAHERGIIHRDLKPANIKLTPDGKVKVLDFGLAKAMESGTATTLSNSPTMLSAATNAGVILGTAAYMSPEQAKGRVVDKRSDIFAFGCVLFEMLSGKPAFEGDDATDIIGAVLRVEPDWTRLPAGTPSTVKKLLRLCLEKDVKKRRRDAGDVVIDIDQTLAEPVATAATAAPASRMGWISFAVALLAAVALSIPAMRHLREAAPPETRVDIVTPVTSQPESFALSPDGRQIVFVASGDGASRLWLRSLATTTPQPLTGTDGATYPFWAPDGRSVGFFAGGQLKRLDLGAGAPQTLAPAANGGGGTWNADGVIVFAPSLTGPLMRVSAVGGATTTVTTLTQHQVGHFSPYFLTDGRRFLFTALAGSDAAGIYLSGIDGRAPTRLTPDFSSAVCTPDGWLLWARAGRLVAQRLDVSRAALTGEERTLADTVGRSTVSQVAVSVAATGLVAYRAAGGAQRQLTWFDRSGMAKGVVGDRDETYIWPRISPDGRRVAVDRVAEGNTDLWLLDGARTTRFTFDPASDIFPVWSLPDGARIVFQSRRTGQGDLYQRLISGGTEDLLLPTDVVKAPNSWSADGRYLMYTAVDPKTNSDLWVLPMTGDRTPWVFLKTPFRETYGEFSPDGRWVAYQSNENGGRPEVYVRPFVPPGAAGTAGASAAGSSQVSTAGGITPLWRPDGKELYYINPSGAMMAAPITVTGNRLEPGAPVVLFPTHIVGGGADTQIGRQYDLARDGRFLINTQLNDLASPITLLQNWNPEVKK